MLIPVISSQSLFLLKRIPESVSDTVILVAGARPNFMKIAPIHKQLRHRGVNTLLVHTGQHYDHNMSQVFFDELGIPEPDIHMGVGSDSHSRQTAKIMIHFEDVCLEHNPRMVVVVGDVNSTLACAITAKKLGITVAHVEAGLRSRDIQMPEEINRVLTDRISDLLFTTSRGANENLFSEGCSSESIFFVGNVMIDSLYKAVKHSQKSTILKDIGVVEQGYCLVTMHRPSNVDNLSTLSGLILALEQISREIPIIIPAHPRTVHSLERFEMADRIRNNNQIYLIPAQGYFDFINLVKNSKFVMTDSGGLQEESTILGVQCLTLRKNTERPITVTQGTNKVVGTETKDIIDAFHNLDFSKKTQSPEYWDGKTAHRIAKVIVDQLSAAV